MPPGRLGDPVEQLAGAERLQRLERLLTDRARRLVGRRDLRKRYAARRRQAYC